VKNRHIRCAGCGELFDEPQADHLCGECRRRGVDLPEHGCDENDMDRYVEGYDE
jgi:hypothetical protein